MKRCLFIFLFGLLLSVTAQAAGAPSVSAQSALLMEAESGKVLFEKDADEAMLVASTTKILTALLTLEACDPETVVEVRPEWTNIEGSSMYLKAGQSLTVRELLYGLLLASGNDAAVALACVTAGSVEAFADRMNRRAEELGCENSHFVNPNGLDDPEHYSCARDLARITRAALEQELFCEIVGMRTAAVGEMSYRNHNRLLGMYDGVFGVKTGYTKAAGRSLVSCCRREDMTLICVTLNAPDDWNDHMSLYDWGFANWGVSDLTERMEASVPVEGGSCAAVAVAPEGPARLLMGSGETVTIGFELPRFVYAGVREGALAGWAVAYADGEERGRWPLYYSESVSCVTEELSMGEKFSRFMKLAGRNIYSF